jgi:D-proline reductase (dithiol) PrdB
VRLSDVEDSVANFLREIPLPEFESQPWQAPRRLANARVAIVSTAGLHRRSDRRFRGGAGDYRIIPGDVEPDDLLMSHVSVNFDRSGFQQDLNVVFPLELLHGMAEEGAIGSVGDWHYSFMGATDPTQMKDGALEVAKLLKEDQVTAVLLVPV